jgi:hypothetical protein
MIRKFRSVDHLLNNLNETGRVIDFSWANITDSDIQYLVSEWKEILHRDLILTGTRVTGDVFKYLDYIHTLNLSFTPINFIFEKVHIHTLVLTGTYIRNSDLSMLVNVHTLDLSCCNDITDASLLQDSTIHTLNLSRTGIKDVSYLKRIHTLDISYCDVSLDCFVADEDVLIHTLIIHGIPCDVSKLKERVYSVSKSI